VVCCLAGSNLNDSCQMDDPIKRDIVVNIMKIIPLPRPLYISLWLLTEGYKSIERRRRLHLCLLYCCAKLRLGWILPNKREIFPNMQYPANPCGRLSLLCPVFAPQSLERIFQRQSGTCSSFIWQTPLLDSDFRRKLFYIRK
jgi:hypothetical protein